MKLYSDFRSSAAYRVRIALNLKGLSYDYLPVHLVRNGGEQLAPSFRETSPDGLVPVLVDGDDTIQQSLCCGDTPSLADLCLVPQVFNAQRFEIDTQRYPTIQRIHDAATSLDAFVRAAPGRQPDAE